MLCTCSRRAIAAPQKLPGDSKLPDGEGDDTTALDQAHARAEQRRQGGGQHRCRAAQASKTLTIPHKSLTY